MNRQPEVFAELNEAGDRIWLHFRYTEGRKNAAKAIPGRAFVPADKGGPAWSFPLDLVTARAIHQAFPDLTIGNGLRSWGKEEVAKERTLRSLAAEDDVPKNGLKIDKTMKKLAKYLRPYQRADAASLAASNKLNGNEPRLGKTVEVIAAVHEAGLGIGPHLVIAPKTLLEDPWRKELEFHQELPVFTLSGETPNELRAGISEWIMEATETAGGYWFVTTPHMLRNGELDWSMLEKDDFEWNSVTIDEFRKLGLNNMKSQLHKKMMHLRTKRKYALSGTPMGGRIVNLFPVLQWLEPQKFTSKWRWVDQWLVVTQVHIGRGRTARDVGGIKPGYEDAFYASLAPHMIRRKREEVLPELPSAQIIDVWCEMTKAQREQYRKFAIDAEIRIEERRLTAASILAEYARLKVFAGAYCDKITESVFPCHKCEGTGWLDDRECVRCQGSGEWVVLHPIPSRDSGKLEPLLTRLNEAGIDAEEPTGDTQVVIASQFKEIADMVHGWLNDIGIPAEKMTGDTPDKDRLRIRRAFQAGEGPRVLVMTTQTGGYGIELNRASEIHVLDETWDPDDQQQVIDRLVNTTRIHQITAFFYRMHATIEEYIQEVNIDKAMTNRDILDLRRHGFRATIREEAKAV
jgi:SNF2 family DNA or RNA helicase